MKRHIDPGVWAAIGAAALFGASTPLSKILLGQTEPVMLAGLLYLGCGIGLFGWKIARFLVGSRHSPEARLQRADLPWLGGAILLGGVVAPVLLLLGLSVTTPSTGALLLNLEGVFTALLAWFVFRENFDRRIAIGMGSILAGGLLLSWQGRPLTGVPWGLVAIAGACLCWAVDNNLTRKVSAADPVQIAALKGSVAGVVNVTVAISLGARFPAVDTLLAAALLGALSYGVSLTCFVLALRQIGTARTGAYFSTAPFIGVGLSLLIFPEWPSPLFWMAAVLMGFGVWLHVTERHEHRHLHEPLDHEHLHRHDEHHQHEHSPTDPTGEPHSHPHHHGPLTHRHSHYPDIHHRHDH